MHATLTRNLPFEFSSYREMFISRLRGELLAKTEAEMIISMRFKGDCAILWRFYEIEFRANLGSSFLRPGVEVGQIRWHIRK